MKKGQDTPETRKIAMRTYLEFGGKNIKAILERLENDHGLRMSAQTLLRWAGEGRWKERLHSEGLTDFEEAMFFKLLKLIERIEHRQTGNPALDIQASYACASLINTALRLKEKIPAEKLDPERMRQVASEILEQEYGIKRD